LPDLARSRLLAAVLVALALIAASALAPDPAYAVLGIDLPGPQDVVESMFSWALKTFFGIKVGLWPATGVDVSTVELDEEAVAKVDALSEPWRRWSPTFTEEDLDRARAAGVLYADSDGTGSRAAVFCNKAVFTDVLLLALERDVVSHEARIAKKLDATWSANGAQSQADSVREREKAKRRAQRVRDQKIAKQARGANLDLGVRLAQKVKIEGLDKSFVQLCAYTILGEPASYAMGDAAGAYSVADLAGAPEEMAKRLVIALAATEYAVAEALPMSRRTPSPLRNGRNGKALAALKRLTRGAVPATVKHVPHAIDNPTNPTTRRARA
jgi:hypothetical protein